MTSRNANASRRLPHPSKQKTARPARPSLPADLPKKPGPPPSDILTLSPQQGPGNGHGPSQAEASGPTSASPTAPPERVGPKKGKTITVKDAAFRLNKSEDTIYLWLHTGRLRGWQVGGSRCPMLVEEASVEKALGCRVGADGKGAG